MMMFKRFDSDNRKPQNATVWISQMDPNLFPTIWNWILDWHWIWNRDLGLDELVFSSHLPWVLIESIFVCGLELGKRSVCYLNNLQFMSNPLDSQKTKLLKTKKKLRDSMLNRASLVNILKTVFA